MRSARGVGGTARKMAKLGAILDQVHTQLVTERTKGIPNTYISRCQGYKGVIKVIQSLPCY